MQPCCAEASFKNIKKKNIPNFWLCITDTVYETLEYSKIAVQFVTYTSNIVWQFLIKSPAKWCLIYMPKPLFTFIWHLMRINSGPQSQVFIPRMRQICAMSAQVTQAFYHFIPLHPSPPISNWEAVYRTLITFSKVAGWKSVRFWKTLRVRCAGTHSSIIHDSGRTFRAGISKLPPGVNVPCTLNKSRNQCPRLQPLCFQTTETAVRYDTWTAADLLHDFERVYCVWPLEEQWAREDRWRQSCMRL